MRNLNTNTFKLSLLLTSVSAAALAAACGGDDAATITCGKGTRQEGTTCVVDEPSGGGGGGEGNAGGAAHGQAGEPSPPMGGSGGAAGESSGPSLPQFAGVTATAPASETSVLVVWNPATFGATAASDFVYEVYVATESGAQNFKAPTVTTPPGATSALVTGLEADTTYFIVVRAVAPDGTKDENAAEVEAMPGADTEAPTFDGVVDAEATGPTSIKLSWGAAEDDQTPPEAIVYVAYLAEAGPGTEDYTGAPIAVSEPGASELVVSGLAKAETAYQFVVRARDAAGNSDENTEEIEAKTGPDTTPPVFGGCSLATQTGATSVFVSWKPARDDVTLANAIEYNVYVAEATGEQDFTLPVAKGTGGSGVEVDGLSASTNYYFVCRAKDASENEERNTAERQARTGDDGEPPVFSGVESVVKNVSFTSVELTWQAATDDKTEQKDIVYDVFRSSQSTGQSFDTPVATSDPGATSIVVGGLPPNQIAYFVVRARDKAGNSSQNQQEVMAKTLVSFLQNIQPILTATCATPGCHTGLSPTGDMNLELGGAPKDPGAYDDILNVPSSGKPGKVRVKPNSTAESYLYMKITGAAGIVGSVMPPVTSGSNLAAEQIQLIADWINQGAQLDL